LQRLPAIPERRAEPVKGKISFQIIKSPSVSKGAGILVSPFLQTVPLRKWSLNAH
jgi:hypothetical protein